jgi:hypothetical protein
MTSRWGVFETASSLPDGNLPPPVAIRSPGARPPKLSNVAIPLEHLQTEEDCPNFGKSGEPGFAPGTCRRGGRSRLETDELTRNYKVDTLSA